MRGDGEKPGKPIRERFLAEGRFLKSYSALNLYSETYMKEIKRRLAHREGLKTDEEIQKRLMEILGRPLTNQNFPKMISDYKTILERI